MGIKEQILNASSDVEIDALLKKAATFTGASIKTKRSWLAAKTKSVGYLKNPSSKPKADLIKPVVISKKKKYKKIKY